MKPGLTFPWSASQGPTAVVLLTVFLSFLLARTKHLKRSNFEEGKVSLAHSLRGYSRSKQGKVSSGNMGQLATQCLQLGGRM